MTEYVYASPERLSKAIAYALRAPLIVWPGYDRPEDLPEMLRALVLPERLALLAKGVEDEATDVEALLYLHTASLATPLNQLWAGIYLKLAKRYMRLVAGRAPGFMEEYGELDEYELGELARLKRWIRSRQEKAVRERDRGVRGIVQAKPREGQLSLLDFTG